MSCSRFLLAALLLMSNVLAHAAGGPPHELRPGLYVGGQPDPAQLQALATQGVTTVIDLRGADEDRGYPEAERVRALGLHYVALPVDGAAGVSEANARALQQVLASSEGPVLLHCASGNRVGALLALVAHERGASEEAAVAEGRAAGLGSLEPTVRARIRGTQP